MKIYKKIILTLAIIFSFISVFPTLSIATVKKEDKAIGALVSVGLISLTKVEVIGVLAALGLRVALDYQNPVSNVAILDFAEKQASLLGDSTMIGKSENGIVAISKKVMDEFFSYLKAFNQSMDGIFTGWYGGFPVTQEQLKSLVGTKFEVLTNGSVGECTKSHYTWDVRVGDTVEFVARPFDNNYGVGFKITSSNGTVQNHYSSCGIVNNLVLPRHNIIPSDDDMDSIVNSVGNSSDLIVKPTQSLPLNKFPSLDLSKNDVDITTGVLKPNGDINDDKEPTKPDIPDIPLPDGFLPKIEIKNHSDGKKLTPYHDYGKEAKFIDVLIHGKSWLTLSDAWFAPKDEEIKNAITKSATFTFGNKVQNNAIVKNFEWEKSPSYIVDNSLGGREVSFKVLFQVPYPHGNIEGDIFMVNMDLYSSAKRAGYSTHTAKLNNMKFTILNSSGDIPEVEIGPHPPLDSNGDNICDSSNPNNPHPPTDSDGDGNCDHNDNGGGTTNPPIPPEGGGDEGDGKPEFPKPPISTDIWEWVSYLMDVITYFFRILIWVVTRPFVFVFDSIKTLGSYITSGLTTMGDVGNTVKSILSWIPDDIMGIFWGIFSLIITFCSIKLFKNFANK